MVNSDFFEIFNLPIIKGNKATALKDKSGLVLSNKTAERLFPGTNAVGKTVSRKSFDGAVTYYTVTAIAEDIPANTHFSTDVISWIFAWVAMLALLTGVMTVGL